MELYAKGGESDVLDLDRLATENNCNGVSDGEMKLCVESYSV